MAEQTARNLKIPLVRLIDGSSGGGSVTTMLDTGYTYIPPLKGMHTIIGSLSEIPVATASLGPGKLLSCGLNFLLQPKQFSSPSAFLLIVHFYFPIYKLLDWVLLVQH